MDGMGLNPENDNISVYILICISMYVYIYIYIDMYTQKWILISIGTDVTKCYYSIL